MLVVFLVPQHQKAMISHNIPRLGRPILTAVPALDLDHVQGVSERSAGSRHFHVPTLVFVMTIIMQEGFRIMPAG